MFRWLAFAAVMFPLAVQAAPVIGPDIQGPTPVHEYVAPAPTAPSRAPHNGWGWRASVDGRWTDIDRSGLDWSGDPGMSAKDIEAGYEWRRGLASAVLGYGQPYEGADENPELWDRVAQDGNGRTGDPGVLGLSLVLRSR